MDGRTQFNLDKDTWDLFSSLQIWTQLFQTQLGLVQYALSLLSLPPCPFLSFAPLSLPKGTCVVILICVLKQPFSNEGKIRQFTCTRRMMPQTLSKWFLPQAQARLSLLPTKVRGIFTCATMFLKLWSSYKAPSRNNQWIPKSYTLGSRKIRTPLRKIQWTISRSQAWLQSSQKQQVSTQARYFPKRNWVPAVNIHLHCTLALFLAAVVGMAFTLSVLVS